MSEFKDDIDEETFQKVDKHGFSIKPEISDTKCILICLKNAPCGTDSKQIARLVNMYEYLNAKNH